MLKQLSQKGQGAKQGWTSSRSSSGEGPDEITAIDEVNQNDAASPSYKSSTTVARQASAKQDSFSFDTSSSANVVSASNQAATTLRELESDESRKLVAEADDLKSKLRELNIGSLEGDPEG